MKVVNIVVDKNVLFILLSNLMPTGGAKLEIGFMCSTRIFLLFQAGPTEVVQLSNQQSLKVGKQIDLLFIDPADSFTCLSAEIRQRH